MQKKIVLHIVSPLLAISLFASIGCGSTDTVPAKPYGEPSTPVTQTVPFYDESVVLDFKLTFTDDQWAAFQRIHDNPPPPDMRDTYPKVYVHCGFEALGFKFPDAACRPKGNPSYWKDEKKPQFVIKFDHFDSQGRFLTLRALNLEAAPFGEAPVRDRLGMWLMREAGIKASRVNHVRVYKNGALLGLYMNIEEVDKEFLQWQFTNSKGNLYAQGFKLETNTKTPDTSRLERLNDLIQNEPLSGDHDQFFTEIEQLMDIHALLAETAAEVVQPTGDNWSNGGSNFDYYDDPASGKFILLPWDLDTILTADTAPASADIYAFWGVPSVGLAPNKLLQLLYQKPAWKKEFEDNLVKVRDTVYSRLSAYAQMVCAQIRDAFVQDQNRNATPEDFDADCAYIKKHIADRTAYIHQALGR